MNQSNCTVTLSVELSDEVVSRLSAYANQNGITIAQTVQDLIEDKLEELEQ